ncbi:MAG: DUF4350 domain-containing protein [Terriglobales bacterium]
MTAGLPRGLGLVLAAAGLGAVMFFASRAAEANHTALYSSLRSDPQGTSLLFGAYQRAGLRVARGYSVESLQTLDPKAAVVFVVAPEDWQGSLAGQIEAFARRGGRVVLAAPVAGGVAARLGAEVAGPPQPGIALEGTGLPVAGFAPVGALELPLLDARFALRMKGPWQPIYQRGNAVYMAQRGVGAGEVVVASEAGFLSNEILAQRPDPALLSWLAGGRAAVWVDETTHALGEVRGLPWLVRRYRLGTGLLWVLVAGGLGVWMKAARLERAPTPEVDAEVAVRETMFDGYARLLQRTRILESK